MPKRTSWMMWAFLGLVAVFIVRSMTGEDSGSSRPTPTPVVFSSSAPSAADTAHRYPGVAQPVISPSQQKEIDRLGKLDQQGFCSKELRKLKGRKTPFAQPWHDALLARSLDFGVDPGDIDSIQQGGVLIGMSQCSALAAWGAPQRVNRSTTSRSVREQWVYGRNYLYFVDGKLTTIHN